MTSRSYWPSTRVDIQPSIARVRHRNLGTENGLLAVHLVLKLGGDRFQESLKAGEVGVDPALGW